MISLTERAAAEVRQVQREKGIEDFGLRVQVVGGGCEGFLYDLFFADQPEPEDRVFDSQGVHLYVDPKALSALDGLTIDYAPTRYGEGFVFNNPHARNQCSCGASFAT